jgi:hypothetical protein
MAKIYPSSELIVTGYVKTVQMRGQYATLILSIPADSFVGKDGQRREVPEQVHKMDVSDAFREAINGLDIGSRVRVVGKGSARVYTDKVTGENRTFTSFRITDLQPCNDLAELPQVDASDIPF